MNFELTEEQKLFKKTVKDFINKEIEPLTDKAESKGKFPLELFPKLGKMGFLGIAFPEEYGGGGGDKITECIFVEEMGSTCSGMAMGINAHVGLSCLPIWKFGTEKQKQKYLVPGLAGEKIGGFGLTERSAGSDATAIKTVATKENGLYVLNGGKTWIGNAPNADFIIVAAYTDKTERGKGISLFIVETDFPGFEITREIEKVGHRSADNGEFELTDCPVPEENLLGENEGGFGDLMEILVGARIAHAVKSVGLAQAAFDYALKYSKEREAFGKPISKFQSISFKLAQMAMKTEAARLMSYKAAWLYDNGKNCVKEASMAKLYASQAVQCIATEAVQILGGWGYSAEFKAERFYRDALVASITEGTSEIQKVIIGRELGL